MARLHRPREPVRPQHRQPRRDIRRRQGPHQRIENFWALLKRGLNGTYVSVEPFHLFRYLDERVFTFNERDLTDLGRFTTVLGRISNLRLTYAELIA
jgi:hypothetical protein